MRLACVWLGLVVAVVACEEKPNANALTEAGAETACDRLCLYREECGVLQDYEVCLDTCIGNVVGWASSDAFNAYTSCVYSLDCEEFEEDCEMSIGILEVHQRWLTECRAALGMCEGYTAESCEFGGTFGDFSVVAFVAPSIITQMTACLAEVDCAARAACLQPIIDEYGFGL